MYRRFREFVALQRELVAAAGAAAAAAAAECYDDDDDAGPPRAAEGPVRRRRRRAAAAAAAAAVPALPRRRWFGSQSPAVLRERVWGLDAFLAQLVALAAGPPESAPAGPGLARAVAAFLMLVSPDEGGGR